MSSRIVTLDTATHKAVQELLPWFVMLTLEGDELTMVREHLHVCTQCQADVEWQRKLQAVSPAAAATAAAPDVERALARLGPKLAVPPRGPQCNVLTEVLTAWLRKLMRGDGQRTRWVLAAQFALSALVIGLGIMLAPPDRDGAPYRVLGARSGAGNVVVMFKPDTTEQELRRILHQSGARVVDGPTVTDAYLLSVPAAQLAGAVTGLRAQRAVVLAEPLSAGGGP